MISKININKIRCDNADENQGLEKKLRKLKFLVNFEQTAPGTPQQNGRVERKFAILFGYTWSILNGTGLTKGMKQRL